MEKVICPFAIIPQSQLSAGLSGRDIVIVTALLKEQACLQKQQDGTYLPIGLTDEFGVIAKEKPEGALTGADAVVQYRKQLNLETVCSNDICVGTLIRNVTDWHRMEDLMIQVHKLEIRNERYVRLKGMDMSPLLEYHERMHLREQASLLMQINDRVETDDVVPEDRCTHIYLCAKVPVTTPRGSTSETRVPALEILQRIALSISKEEDYEIFFDVLHALQFIEECNLKLDDAIAMSGNPELADDRRVTYLVGGLSAELTLLINHLINNRDTKVVVKTNGRPNKSLVDAGLMIINGKVVRM